MSLKKGSASPLEGVVGKEGMMVLRLAFALIGFGMIRGLTHAASASLGNAHAAAAPTAGSQPAASNAPDMTSSFSAPRPPK